MRPISITLSGVRSYTDTCGPLDFTGKSLVGILGDTGAGKSTLLEAITYALYGRTSWGEGGSQLIADGCETMSVDFTFAVDGTAWRVTRTCHRNGRATQAGLHATDAAKTTAVNDPRRVNRRIEELLNLDYTSFKSAVLLPQGKFDTLLMASDTTRTQLLKSLLGVDELQRLRQRAEDHRARLSTLLRKAAEARGRLREDPEADAHHLRIRHAKAAKAAADLSGHLGTLRRLREQAGDLRQHDTEATRALATLAERAAADVHTPLAALLADDRALQAQLDADDRRREEATRRRDLLQAALEADRDSGLTVTTLTAATTVLEGAPRLLSSLGEQQQELTQDRDRLEEDERSFAQDQEHLSENESLFSRLEKDAERARAQADGARSALDRLIDAVRVLLEEAAAAAEHRTAQSAARDALEELAGEAANAQTALDTQRGVRDEASRALDDIRRSEAAHTAGADLSPGEHCPVCTHLLDAAYAAPQPLDPKALARTKRAHTAASTAFNDALGEQQRIQADIRQATRAGQEHQEKAEAAEHRIDAQLGLLHDHVRELAAATGLETSESFAAHLVAEVNDAVLTLIAQTPPNAAERHALAETLLGSAALRVEEAQQSATAVRSTAQSVAAETQTARSALALRRKALEASRKNTEQAQQRLDHSRQEFLDSLQAMPHAARLCLPASGALPSLEDIAACTADVKTHLGRLGHLEGQYTQVLKDLQELAEQSKELADAYQRRVAGPLREQRTTLELRTEAATTAVQLLPDGTASLPPRPASWDNPQDVADFATALDTTCDTLRAALERVQREARETVDALAAKAAAAWKDLEPLAPGAPVPTAAGRDLLFNPDLLTPLHEQAGALHADAAQAKSGLEEALSQIPYARTLQAAMEAGEQQLSAWAGLCAALTDSGFPRHLTNLRTQSLLHLGSRLLRGLSADRLAFSEDFRIVSLDNNTARSPKTLSGGETFQASLALSLALVELHSRSSARLESLFLDEGFATLDAGALESALSALRTHVGSAKLLTVISHLHPVAESVKDVLWVEKDLSGSTARWLTPEEHHDLVRSDFHKLADLT